MLFSTLPEKMEDPTPVDPPNFSIFLKVTPVSSLPKKNGKSGSAPPLLISKFPFLTSVRKHYVLTILFGVCSVFPKNFQKISKKMEKHIDTYFVIHAIIRLYVKIMKLGGILWTRSLGGRDSQKAISTS